MAGNHKLVKINAPVPSLVSGKKGVQFTVFAPDDGSYATYHCDVPEENWGDTTSWSNEMCVIDPLLDIC